MGRGWIEGDESAKEMLARVLTQSPFLLLPPLHWVPLRLGNVVEIIGPSPSAKTHILIQVCGELSVSGDSGLTLILIRVVTNSSRADSPKLGP